MVQGYDIVGLLEINAGHSVKHTHTLTLREVVCEWYVCMYGWTPISEDLTIEGHIDPESQIQGFIDVGVACYMQTMFLDYLLQF